MAQLQQVNLWASRQRLQLAKHTCQALFNAASGRQHLSSRSLCAGKRCSGQQRRWQHTGAAAAAAGTVIDTLTITTPDDWHLHVRDGDNMRSVVPHTAQHFARAIIMPNLVPPVTTTALVRRLVLAALSSTAAAQHQRPSPSSCLPSLTYLWAVSSHSALQHTCPPARQHFALVSHSVPQLHLSGTCL